MLVYLRTRALIGKFLPGYRIGAIGQAFPRLLRIKGMIFMRLGKIYVREGKYPLFLVGKERFTTGSGQKKL